MKVYVYLLVSDDNQVIAAYDRVDLANKLLGPIEEKLKTKLKIKKQRINPDLTSIGS